MFKISPKNTFLLKEVDQSYRGDKILHMQLQQEAYSTTCLGLPKFEVRKGIKNERPKGDPLDHPKD